MPRKTFASAVLLASALGSASAASEPAALLGGGTRARRTRSSRDEELALAMVVDSREWPEEAAALEVRPYRMLLEKVRLGAGERTLSRHLVALVTDEELLRDPDAFRGRIVYGSGIIGEVRRVDAPGVGRFDRNEVYAGTVGNLKGGSLDLFAFRALRRANQARLYPGDKVWVSGYFLKMVPLVDARGRTRWAPLVVSPWPTYIGEYHRWFPGVAARKTAEGLGLSLPTREVPHEEVLSRRVLDVEAASGPAAEIAENRSALGGEGPLRPRSVLSAASAVPAVPAVPAVKSDRAARGGEGRWRFAVDGVPLARDDAVEALRRHAAAHPGRVVVARASGEEARAAARELFAEAGIERVLFKELRRPGGRMTR